MADTYLERAAELIRDGRFDAAIGVLQQHLARHPTDSRAVLLQANAFSAKGEHDRALALAARAVELEPRNPQARILKAMELFHSGQSDLALREFKSAARLAPGSAEAWANLAIALLKLGRAGASISAFQKAIALSPDQPKLRAQLASAYQAGGDYTAAARHFAEAKERDPGDLDYRVALANAFRLDGALHDAIEVLQQAARELGNSGRLEEHVGSLYLGLGDLAMAARHFREALLLDPGEANALLGLCRLEAEEPESGIHERVKSRLSDPRLPESDRISLLFAQGTLLNGQNRHEEAMIAFAEGNRRKRATLNYDPVAHASHFARMKAAFPADLPRAVGGNPSRVPIFIVGMPRSGTTLVEQILAAHPAVRAGGELPYVERIILDWPDWADKDRRYPEDVATMSAGERQDLGQRYLDKIQKLSSEGGRVTDKMPYNFMHLGLISRILPNAKIVHCRRDAMDTCASNFTILFNGDSGSFSYDLAELAGFYKLYDGLMTHWKALLGRAIHEVRYEDLVTNQQPESRRLLDHCELDWTEQVLSYQTQGRPVLTASSIQVRNAPYQTAIGKWRRYGRTLDQLKQALHSTS